ncbi:MAG: LptF/LptG family permease, partial [Rickettsiales bacterium]|nr:LptF/LptG family permease [Rickettsiales bacterium]
KPLILSAFLIGVFDIFVINPTTVFFNKQVEILSFKYGISSTSPFDLSEKGFWLREKKDEGYNILYAGKIKQVEDKLYLDSVILFVTDFDHNFVKRIESSNGVLSNYTISFKESYEIAPGKETKKLSSAVFPTQLTIEKIKDTYASTDIISFWQLPGLIKFFNELGFSVRRQVAYFVGLLIYPVFLIAFVLIGACFSMTNQPRARKAMAKMSLGMVCGFIVYFLDQIVSSMGASGTLPVALGVIGIPLIAIFGSVWLLFHQEES